MICCISAWNSIILKERLKLVLIVFYIFYIANTSEIPILKQANEVLQEFVEREGSMECDRLEKTCINCSRHEVSHSESEDPK